MREINRRGFFQGILGIIGGGVIAKTIPSTPKVAGETFFQFNEKALSGYKLGFCNKYYVKFTTPVDKGDLVYWDMTPGGSYKDAGKLKVAAGKFIPSLQRHWCELAGVAMKNEVKGNYGFIEARGNFNIPYSS